MPQVAGPSHMLQGDVKTEEFSSEDDESDDSSDESADDYDEKVSIPVTISPKPSSQMNWCSMKYVSERKRSTDFRNSLTQNKCTLYTGNKQNVQVQRVPIQTLCLLGTRLKPHKFCTPVLSHVNI